MGSPSGSKAAFGCGFPTVLLLYIFCCLNRRDLLKLTFDLFATLKEENID